MEIILAKSIGFCSGVRRAVDTAMSMGGKGVFVLGELIHNETVTSKLKEKGAGRIFVFSTFGLFVEGLEKFDEYHKNGVIDKVFTTNLIYQTPELLSRDWYCSVNMSKYIALLVDTLNNDNSISKLLDPADKIKAVVAKYEAGGKI